MTRSRRCTAWMRAASVALVLAGVGCASRPTRTPPPAPPVDAAAASAADASRAQWSSQHRDWTVTGRVAVSKAGKGGSGRIEWNQTGDAYAVALSAPITRQSWRLTGDTHHEGGRIEGLDGGPREGDFADELLLQATGWDVPVNQLPEWMRGLAAPGMPVDELTRGADGLPARLKQAGWTIDYLRWTPAQGARPPLPSRIEARRDDASVKLVVDDWTFPTP